MYSPSAINLVNAAYDTLKGAEGILGVGYEYGNISPKENEASFEITNALCHLDVAINLLEGKDDV